ncbi:MAG TPA: hypothetical protein VGI79_23285 [Caulobacteraceae bacterium]
METTGLKRRLPTPEECVAMLRFEAASTTVAIISLGISGVMMVLVWRVLIS